MTTVDLPDPKDDGAPRVPPLMPRTGIAKPWRRFCWWVFHRLAGWRFVGDFPNLPKVVLIIAPHSSAWDAVWGVAAKIGLDLGMVFMAKQEAFVGPVGWLLRRAGGVPVNRAAPGGIVGQIAGEMRRSERMWFLLAPEGTRRRVARWKHGFWNIARAADAPVLLMAFDYPTKTIHIGPLVALGDDVDADVARIREWYLPFRGKRHDGR